MGNYGAYYISYAFGSYLRDPRLPQKCGHLKNDKIASRTIIWHEPDMKIEKVGISCHLSAYFQVKICSSLSYFVLFYFITPHLPINYELLP